MAGNDRPAERAAALKRMDNKIAKLDESWYTTMCKTRELRQESERVSKEIGLELGMIKMLVALVAGREQAFKMTGEWKDWQDKTVRSSMATLHETGEATAVQAPSGGVEVQKVEGELVIRRPNTHGNGEKRKDAEDARVREAVAKAKAEARGGLLHRVLG